ncbi:MAG: murein biosynthesis integral membrane protein MurJ [Deltaproteobacteria bacterium]|nr:murein biosynthesis integral membrane protein MurJ [Deltaproteobacteria bacterium]
MSLVKPTHVSRKILNAAALVAAATVLAKCVAMAKEVVVAAAFGTGDAMDAYVIAFTIPAYLINVASGSLNVALIPTYIEIRDRQGKESARNLLTSALLLNIGLLLALAGILSFCAPTIFSWITSDFSSEKVNLSLQLFAVLLPCVLISGISVTLEAVLNADERFFGAGLAPAVIPIAIMAVVLCAAPEWGAYSLAIGTLFGYAIELIMVLVLIRRAGIPFSLRWPGVHPALRTVLKQYLPAISGSSLMCSAIVIDQTMSASLGSGNVSALNYGNKLVAVLVGAVTVALGTAVLPFFSTLTAKKDWHTIRQTLRHYVLLILATTIPATILFVYLSEPIVQLLYQRGAFSQADTQLVSRIQAVLALQIPFHTLGILFVRLLSSMKLNYFMFLSNIVSVVLNISLNFLFMHYWGIVGIALSTVVVYFAAAAFMGIVVHRKLAAFSREASI